MYTTETHERVLDIAASMALGLPIETSSCRPDHLDDQNDRHMSHHSEHYPKDRPHRNPEYRSRQKRNQATTPIIYVCSRFRGKNQSEIERNICRAQEFSSQIRLGWKAPAV